MGSVLKGFCDIVRTWTCGDRIRVSPTEGRLLGIRCGDRLLIFGDVYLVHERVEQDSRIVFKLDGSADQSELVVVFGGQRDGKRLGKCRGELACRGELVYRGELPAKKSCSIVFDQDVQTMEPIRLERIAD